MKNWFVNNFVNPGVVIGGVTAFLYFIGVATQAGYDKGIGVSSGLFPSSFYDMVVCGTIFLTKGVIGLSYGKSAKLLLIIILVPAVALYLKHSIFAPAKAEGGKYSKAFEYGMFGYYGFFLVVIAFGCIAYVFSFFVTMGSTQAEQDLKGFSVSDRVQAIHLDDELIIGSVLKCSASHCAFIHAGPNQNIVSVIPVSRISRIRDYIKANKPTMGR